MKKVYYLFFFILISFQNVFADDSIGYIDPSLGGFQIQNSDSIEMTEEIVEIWEDHVKVTFWFTNLEDKEQNVTIGFPVEDFEYKYYNARYGYDCLPLQDDEDTRNKITKYYNFRSTCNGENLKRTLVTSAHVKDYNYDDNLFDFWFTTELNFKPKETLVVVDEYVCGKEYGHDSIGWTWNNYGYVLTTGSTWANSIKKAIIIFHTKEEITWDNIAVVEKDNPSEHYSVQSGLSYQSEKVIWNMEDMSYIWNICTYTPTKIENKKDETTITWILQNIEPKDDWVLHCYKATKYCPFCYIDYDLISKDLMKIPEYAELSKRKPWLKASEDESSRKNSNKRFISNSSEYQDIFRGDRDFRENIKTMYKIGYVDSQKKTKITETIAQVLINALYASYHYEFKDQKWKDVFNQYDWYYFRKKSKDVSQKDFTKEEVEMIKDLQRYTGKNDYIAKYSVCTKCEGLCSDKKIEEEKIITEVKIISNEDEKLKVHIYRTMTPFSQVLDFDAELNLKGDKYVFDCYDNWQSRVTGWLVFDGDNIQMSLKDKEIYEEANSISSLYDETPLIMENTTDDINFIRRAMKY